MFEVDSIIIIFNGKISESQRNVRFSPKYGLDNLVFDLIEGKIGEQLIEIEYIFQTGCIRKALLVTSSNIYFRR